MPELRTRRMPVLAQDSGIRRDDGTILTASVTVPWEDLAGGPTGHRVQVVDYDATTRTMYAPAEVEDGDVRDPENDEEIQDDPAFQAQNVYALVMRTLARFEYALGRRVSWYFRAHQLKVVPHAFEEMNSCLAAQLTVQVSPECSRRSSSSSPTFERASSSSRARSWP